MKRFVVNRHGRLVFPCNFFPALDVSVFEAPEPFEAVIRRDFEEKARTTVEIASEVEAAAYASRYELLRDVAVNLLWATRYGMLLYDSRLMRWRDVPRHRDDAFLPLAQPIAADLDTRAIEAGYHALPPRWDERAEHTIFGLLFDIFRNRKASEHSGRALLPSVQDALLDPAALVHELAGYTPSYPVYRDNDIIGYHHRVPELEALMRHAMVLHNEFPWDRETVRLAPIGELDADAMVLVMQPKSLEVRRFLDHLRSARAPARPCPVAHSARRAPMPVPPVDVRRRFTTMPRIESLAACRGEVVCSNEDLVRNAALCWSPMTAKDIWTKTGIAQRTYTEASLEELALGAARTSVEHAGRAPEELAAVVFCSCTSTRAMPSVAAWISGQLGMYQTHGSYDIVAACAGLPYAIAEAVRLLDETRRPVLVVAGEKFSDKIGTVRTSRMLFGDAAAALVVGPTPAGASPDVEVFQTYAGGPMREVESIVWPNPEFDNDVTVYGPDVRSLARRYLEQMTEELRALPHPDGHSGSLLDAIDLIVPHQANKTMVTALAQAAGIDPGRLYFDIERVGNTSSASIPLALQDAVRDGVITGPTRVFAPGFGAGAVGGYVVMRVDPTVVV